MGMISILDHMAMMFNKFNTQQNVWDFPRNQILYLSIKVMKLRARHAVYRDE